MSTSWPKLTMILLSTPSGSPKSWWRRNVCNRIRNFLFPSKFNWNVSYLWVCLILWCFTVLKRSWRWLKKRNIWDGLALLILCSFWWSGSTGMPLFGNSADLLANTRTWWLDSCIYWPWTAYKPFTPLLLLYSPPRLTTPLPTILTLRSLSTNFPLSNREAMIKRKWMAT